MTKQTKDAKPFEAVGGSKMMVGEMSKIERRKLVESLPADLRAKVKSRFMTLEQAQAWDRLRTVFREDESLMATVFTAFGMPVGA